MHFFAYVMHIAVPQIVSCDMLAMLAILAVLTVISMLAIFVVFAVLSVLGPEFLFASIFCYYYHNFYNISFNR